MFNGTTWEFKLLLSEPDDDFTVTLENGSGQEVFFTKYDDSSFTCFRLVYSKSLRMLRYYVRNSQGWVSQYTAYDFASGEWTNGESFRKITFIEEPNTFSPDEETFVEWMNANAIQERMKRMLNIDPIVKVNVNVGASTASEGVFDVGAIITPTAGTAKGTGDGAVLSTTHRFAVYNSFSEVTNGVQNRAPYFGVSTDVYALAWKYFTVDPAPSKLVVIFYDTANGTTDTPVKAMADAIDKGAEFYGVYYSPKSGETTANIKTNSVAIVSSLEALNRGVLFYGDTGDLATALLDGIIVTMYGTGSRRACGIYSDNSTDDGAALMGAAMGLSRKHADSAFALCYKSIASATASDIAQSQVVEIKEKNANVVVQRTRTRSYVENGAVASGMRFDDVLYVDRMAHDIQQTIYETIADSDVKLPQRDTTSALFISAIGQVLDAYYDMGVLADAAWRGQAVGSVNPGDMIEHGHNEFADMSFDDQSAEDRALRKAVPITVLLCLSGSVESIVITVDVQT